MAERTKRTSTRPRPGPRPIPSAHGSTRRRVAHQAKQPTGAKRAAKSPRRQPTRAPQMERRRRSEPVQEQTRTREPRTRRQNWSLWVGAIVLCAVGALVALVESPFFEVNDVQISGASRTSDGAILDALQVGSNQALLTYDTSKGRNVVADLPWVEAVSVTRQWPSTLRVVVRERTVAAAIGRPSGSEWAVVSTDGVVVEYRMTPPSGVPLIVATTELVDASSIGSPLAGVERALKIAHDLPLQLDPWVTTWSVDADGVVVAELVGSARADFGKLDDHRTQFVSLASILNGGASLVCLETIDLTISDTPVLHRDSTCLSTSRELS
jgi:hypothetical protein